VIFGWQHFLYATFLMTLVPAWLPEHAFWIYFTGTGMIVAGLAIAVNILGSVAAVGLALMFGLWGAGAAWTASECTSAQWGRMEQLVCGAGVLRGLTNPWRRTGSN